MLGYDLKRISEVLSKRESIEWLRDVLLNTRNKVKLASNGYTKEMLRELRIIRERSLEELQKNIEILKENIERRGGFVYLARDGRDACNYVLKVAREKGVKLVVKSKSLTTEEIELNKSLIENGINVVETDLGEWIVQLANQKPSHIIAPAIHMSRYEIARLLNEKVGMPLEYDPTKITRFARQYLRCKFLEADMAITGGNFVVAETGSLVIVTNEGNGRLVTSLPSLHIAIVGLEKIVGRWIDAMKLLDILPKFSTGQKMATYVTIINSGVETISKDGKRKKRELHLVLLDNGRTQALQDKFLRDSLRCIRCSSCFNVCPAYETFGGHMFGYIYSGPMGVPWTYISHGLERAADIASLCIACGLCQDACPMNIKIPIIASYIKYRYGSKVGYKWIDKVLSNYERFIKLASKTYPVSSFLMEFKPVKWLIEKVLGIDRRRQLPRFYRKTLADLLPTIKLESGHGWRKVAYFADSMAYYSSTDIGLAAIEILRRNGIDVTLMNSMGNGMPSLLYGMMDRTREIAKHNVSHGYKYVKMGYDIVSTEPTAIYCFKYVYPEILGTKESEEVAERCYEFSGYIVDLLNEGKLKIDFTKYSGVKAFYHQPCHSRRLRDDAPVLKLLKILDMDVEFANYWCCGMAGTWGLKKGYNGYEISKVIAEPLVKEILRSNADIVVTECSTCKMQIEHFTKKKVLHPAIIMDRAYKGLPLL